MSRAFIGDIHGCYEELAELYWKLRDLGLKPEEILHAGDLVDRGPDSHKVLEFCREHRVDGVVGNHEIVIVEHWNTWQKRGGKLGNLPTRNPDKQRTLQAIDQADVEYMRALPHLRIFDDIKTILVHGGLFPKLEFWQQAPELVCRLQLIHPFEPNRTLWFNKDRKGVTEEELTAKGWRRWYTDWDYEYHVVFGHSGFKKPLVHKNEASGYCIGTDTRCVFGGTLTAVIMPELQFVSVPAKKEWFPSDPEYDRMLEGKNG